MADVEKLAPFIKKWEGGFANDPDDRGGATMCGITLATYQAYCKQKKLPKPSVQDLRNITETEWTEILKTMYWDRWQADKIQSQSIANILVDWVWASGVHGIKRPQKILGVTADGIVGNITLGAVNSSNSRTLFYKIKADRLKFVDEICRADKSQEKFRDGWTNRINNIKYED